MRSIFTVIIVLCSYSIVLAQSSFGVIVIPQAGVTLTNLDNSSDFVTAHKPRIGATYGSSVVLDGRKDVVGLLIGVYYAEKGGNQRFDYRFNGNELIRAFQ